jgi:hypothetical protein
MLLPEYDGGFDAIMANKDKICSNIQGTMSFFPMCCSTGILKNLTANEPKEHSRAGFEANLAITSPDIDKIKAAEYIHEIIRECNKSSRPIFFPREVAAWNALSLVLIKSAKGDDDGPAGGYNNYRAAQIIMCDRVTEDKRDKRFRFGSYNIVFSCDQFMDFLEENKAWVGEVYNSPARPGGHGARVRACTVTPEVDALHEYLDARIDLVRNHVLEVIQGAKAEETVAADKVAATW